MHLDVIPHVDLRVDLHDVRAVKRRAESWAGSTLMIAPPMSAWNGIMMHGTSKEQIELRAELRARLAVRELRVVHDLNGLLIELRVEV